MEEKDYYQDLKDEGVVVNHTITEIVRGTTAKLHRIYNGKLYYRIEVKVGYYESLYELELDSQDREFKDIDLYPEYKAITLMRWIRRGMEDGTFIQLLTLKKEETRMKKYIREETEVRKFVESCLGRYSGILNYIIMFNDDSDCSEDFINVDYEVRISNMTNDNITGCILRFNNDGKIELLRGEDFQVIDPIDFVMELFLEEFLTRVEA